MGRLAKLALAGSLFLGGVFSQLPGHQQRFVGNYVSDQAYYLANKARPIIGDGIDGMINLVRTKQEPLLSTAQQAEYARREANGDLVSYRYGKPAPKKAKVKPASTKVITPTPTPTIVAKPKVKKPIPKPVVKPVTMPTVPTPAVTPVRMPEPRIPANPPQKPLPKPKLANTPPITYTPKSSPLAFTIPTTSPTKKPAYGRILPRPKPLPSIPIMQPPIPVPPLYSSINKGKYHSSAKRRPLRITNKTKFRSPILGRTLKDIIEESLIVYDGVNFPVSKISDEIVAIADGKIRYIGKPSFAKGTVILLQYSGIDRKAVLYSPIEHVRTSVGSKVKAGDRIGYVGENPNLHVRLEFVEVRGSLIDGLDASDISRYHPKDLGIK
ncbi:MAG: M23 family metallopeptidase [Candidatus Nanoarchaeia archaeon]